MDRLGGKDMNPKHIVENVFKDDIEKWAGYKNCKKNRRASAKICKGCPFKRFIEEVEQVWLEEE